MNREEYPVILQVSHVKELLGVAPSTVYELFKAPDFPAIVINSRKLVYRDQFFKWLDGKQVNVKQEQNYQKIK